MKHSARVCKVVCADAMLLARSHGLRAYDAVQLAAALQARLIYQTGGLGPVSLVSADQTLNEAGEAEGMDVDDPNSHP